MRIPFARLHPEAVLPQRMSAQAAGLDLVACLGEGGTMALEPGGRAAVPTGLQMALPEGYEAQVRPRSGLAMRHGVTVLNSPGTIDADYRGEIRVLLVNLGEQRFEIRHGDRIAQMVVAPVVAATPELVASLDLATERGDGGFGSTGGFADGPAPTGDPSPSGR